MIDCVGVGIHQYANVLNACIVMIDVLIDCVAVEMHQHENAY